MSTPPITLDPSTLKPIGAAAPSSITLDKSTLKPIQGTAPPKKGFFQGEPFIGSTGEALVQGMKEESSPESRKAAAEGAAAGFSLMIPGSAIGEALAARSIAPLMPLITSYLGAKFGYHVGKDVGGLIGEPEAGGTVGATLGGLVGGVTGKTPGFSVRKLLLNLLKGGEEGEGVAAATVKAESAAAPVSAAPAVPTTTTPTPSIVSTPTPTPEALHRFSNSEAIRKQILQLAGKE